MTGLGNYGDEGFSSYHANKRSTLVAQSLSSNPTPFASKSPMRDFGISAIIAGLAAAAKAGTAAAVAGAAKLGSVAAGIGGKIATGVGAKGLGAKLAGTGVKLGAKAATKWGAAKTSFGAMKSAFGIGSKKAVAVGPKTTSVVKPPSFGETTVNKVFGPGKTEIGKFVRGKVSENINTAPSRIKGSMDAHFAKTKAEAENMSISASNKIKDAPQIGDTNTVNKDEELASVLTYKGGPFKMKGWSPFTAKAPPVTTMRDKVSGMIGTVATPEKSYIEKYA